MGSSAQPQVVESCLQSSSLPKVFDIWFSSIVFRLKSCTLLVGELRLGSGDVPIEDTAFCDSEDEPGESELDVVEFE